MKKLIVGIIAIFCLELGFVAYSGESLHMIASRPDPATSGSSIAVPYEPEPLIASQAADSEDPAFSSFVNSPRDREVIPRHHPVRHIQVVRSSEYAQFPNIVAKRTPDPKSERYTAVVLSQAPSLKALEGNPNGANYELAAKNKLPRRKKSFFARALPIVKKPYDWLKAVASKLR